MGNTANGWKIALEANQALVASFVVKIKKFNELLHPRGADGRFISKGGYIKWNDHHGTSLWQTGEVISFDNLGSKQIVKVKKSNGAIVSVSADRAYGAKAPVATIPNGFKETMQQIGGQAGGNAGGLYETADHTAKYYVKEPPSAKHSINELVAHKLYAAVGSPTPEVGLSEDKKHFYSKIEESVSWSKVTGSDADEVLNKIRSDFVVDAWLANWDAPAGDNIRVTADGVPLRVDAGGALDYRAMGKSKVDQLTPEVKELKTMRSLSISPAGSKLYGPTTKEQERSGVKRILALSPDAIREIVVSEGGPNRLADDLIARRAWLATEYGYQLPETTPEGKEILAQAAAKSSPDVDGFEDPSLASAVKTLAPGEMPTLAVGSPAWLTNKQDYGTKLGDVWIVTSESPDGTVNLKAVKGSKTLSSVKLSDLEALRSNHTAIGVKYADDITPSSGDHVILSNGEEGVVTQFYPKYAKVQVGFNDDGQPINKVVHINKLNLKHSATVKSTDKPDDVDIKTSSGASTHHSPQATEVVVEASKPSVKAWETGPAKTKTKAWDSHNWFSDPQPAVAYPGGQGKVSLYSDYLPYVIVQTDVANPDSLAFYVVDDLYLI